MDFLWLSIAMFVAFTVALVATITAFVLGAAGLLTLNGTIWVLLAFFFLALSLVELVFYWVIRAELEHRKEIKNEDRRKASNL